jgi:hypothetical protein
MADVGTKSSAAVPADESADANVPKEFRRRLSEVFDLQ